MEYHQLQKLLNAVFHRDQYLVLFLMYINDLCSVCKHTFPILFADDTNLLSSGKIIKTLETNINNELSHISLSLKVNKLSLNIKKTHYMIFHKRKKII